MVMGFVIPAKAGIQFKGLDSPVSSTGQAYQVRKDGLCKIIYETLRFPVLIQTRLIILHVAQGFSLAY
jgi:hypothetical protein